MGPLKLLNTGLSLVGLADKLVAKVPSGEVAPNFSPRPGAMSRAVATAFGERAAARRQLAAA